MALSGAAALTIVWLWACSRAEGDSEESADDSTGTGRVSALLPSRLRRDDEDPSEFAGDAKQGITSHDESKHQRVPQDLVGTALGTRRRPAPTELTAAAGHLSASSAVPSGLGAIAPWSPWSHAHQVGAVGAQGWSPSGAAQRPRSMLSPSEKRGLDMMFKHQQRSEGRALNVVAMERSNQTRQRLRARVEANGGVRKQEQVEQVDEPDPAEVASLLAEELLAESEPTLALVKKAKKKPRKKNKTSSGQEELELHLGQEVSSQRFVDPEPTIPELAVAPFAERQGDRSDAATVAVEPEVVAPESSMTPGSGHTDRDFGDVLAADPEAVVPEKTPVDPNEEHASAATGAVELACEESTSLENHDVDDDTEWEDPAFAVGQDVTEQLVGTEVVEEPPGSPDAAEAETNEFDRGNVASPDLPESAPGHEPPAEVRVQGPESPAVAGMKAVHTEDPWAVAPAPPGLLGSPRRAWADIADTDTSDDERGFELEPLAPTLALSLPGDPTSSASLAPQTSASSSSGSEPEGTPEREFQRGQQHAPETETSGQREAASSPRCSSVVPVKAVVEKDACGRDPPAQHRTLRIADARARPGGGPGGGPPGSTTGTGRGGAAGARGDPQASWPSKRSGGATWQRRGTAVC